MIPVRVEGVRRNFTSSSAFLYSIFLIDEVSQRLLVLGVERHEALPIVATLNNLTLPRQETINLMADTLKSFNYALEEVCIENHSLLPPSYNLCECLLRWRNGETEQVQRLKLRPGDVIGLALLMDALIFVSDDVFEQMGTKLPAGQALEEVFARYLLKREGITLSTEQELRLGYSKTPLRDALVKEFKAALLGKAPIFPEEDMEQRKKEYLAFLRGNNASF